MIWCRLRSQKAKMMQFVRGKWFWFSVRMLMSLVCVRKAFVRLQSCGVYFGQRRNRIKAAGSVAVSTNFEDITSDSFES